MPNLEKPHNTEKTKGALLIEIRSEIKSVLDKGDPDFPQDCVPDKSLDDLELHEIGEYTYEKFLEENIRELGTLLSALKKAEVERVCVEGGHIYLNEEIDENKFFQLKATAHLRKFIEHEGFDVNSLLFVDDYNVEEAERRADIDKYLEIAKELGIDFDRVVAESDMIRIGQLMMETFEKMRGVLRNAKDGSVFLDHRNVKLYDAEKDKYCCCLLDGALSVLKLDQLGDGMVNVLPSSWKSQQSKTRRVVRELMETRKVNFFNLYIDDSDMVKKRSGVPAHTKIRKRERNITILESNTLTEQDGKK